MPTDSMSPMDHTTPIHTDDKQKDRPHKRRRVGVRALFVGMLVIKFVSKLLSVHHSKQPKKRIKWNTRTGYREFVCVCFRRGFRCLVSEQQWLDMNVKARTSIPVHCERCHTDTVASRISRFSNNKGVTCACTTRIHNNHVIQVPLTLSKNIRWASPEGYEKFKTICDLRGCRCPLSLEEWMERRPNAFCNMPIQCLKCKFVATDSRLNDFVVRGNLGCLCYGPRWKTDASFERFSTLCEEKDCEVGLTLDEWRSLKPTAYTFVPIRCKVCLTVVQTTHIHNFVTNGHIACACNVEERWSTEERFHEFNALCQERNCTLLMTWSEWDQSDVSSTSIVKIKCNTCGAEVDTTRILGFTQGRLGCGCYKKSEYMMKVFLQDTFGKDKILDGRVDWCVNPRTGNNFPFDMILEERKQIFEVDGSQHYEEHRLFHRYTSLEQTQARDRYKEKRALANGYSVIRVKQVDIFYDKNDWKQRVLDAIERIDVSNPCVIKLY